LAHFRELIPQAKVTVVAAGLLLLSSVVTESLPLILGTGRHARIDWSFAFVTMRFILQPVAALGIIGFGLFGLVSSLRAHSRLSLAAILLALIVPVLFIALSYFFPLPWLEVALHGSTVPPT